jgi:cellulose synthase/poly-beta-1,6-N-acetylglucosamine synthase-like glycosyltransferase
MNHLVLLRIIGCLFALVVLGVSFGRFRIGKLRRLDFSISLLFSLIMAVIAVNPNIANIFLGMLSLKKQQFARLIAILIFSNFFIWLFLFYTRLKLNEKDEQFDRLIRALGVEEFEKTYGHGSLKPIVVIIPAHNEAENLGHVLKRMPSRVYGMEVSVLVIDDGSEDGSSRIVRDLEFPVVCNKIRRGGGAALRLGYDIALREGAEIVVTMDADGQHLPEEIETLVSPILEGRYDLMIGSRVLGRRERDDPIRYMGIHIFNGMINFLVGTRITDCTNGFRAFKVEELKKVTLRQDQFHTSELIIDAARKGIRIGETPITVLRRKYGTSKKGKNWKYGLNFFKTIIKTWWR